MELRDLPVRTEARMAADRSEMMASAAYSALTPRMRKVFHAISTAIGDGDSAPMSRHCFTLDFSVPPKAIKPSLDVLTQLGLIEVGLGARRVQVFRFGTGWRQLDALAAVRVLQTVREASQQRERPHRKQVEASRLAG
jgi:hypothetical protein